MNDRIERSAVLAASRERVWRALADAEEFGHWFGVNLKGQSFTAGQRARGHITYPGYEHIMFDALVARVEPMRELVFRWHPYAVDPAIDYSAEQPTTVTFSLSDAPGGIQVQVIEAGFDGVPAARREEAYRMNSGGWDAQLENIAEHLKKHPA